MGEKWKKREMEKKKGKKGKREKREKGLGQMNERKVKAEL